ncbi:MAG: alpha-amylase domain-containing protein [Chthoniobacterales bacterium]
MNLIRRCLLFTVASVLWASAARAEVIIQFFETRWDEMYQRLPELAEIGYESIWTPPPSKSPIGGPYPFAYGGNVGYNSFDRFDLGDQPQRGHWETRYGSRTSLRNMVDNAHQMDLKIYPDIVFNHTGNGPDYRTYPGMVPRDFHIYEDSNQPGGFRRPPRMFDWNVNNGYGGTLHQELVSLMDIVLEFDGRFQGSNSPNYAADPAPFVRQPGDYEKYPYHNPGDTLPSENSREFIVRWINWLGYAMDYDGVRLDAPKHVIKEFFGLPNQDLATKNRTFNYNIQRNFKERRFGRPENTGVGDIDFAQMFQNDIRRNDALIYSEFFIGSVGEVDYWRSPSAPAWGIKTRYLDFPRKAQMLNDAFNNGNLSALAGFAGFSPEEGVMFAHSHDERPPSKLELAYAHILTRIGIPVVYFSGNNLRESEIGREPGKNTWMYKGYDYALGDTVNNFQTAVVPNLVYIHNQFCRGREWTRWTENDFFAYERYDDLNSNSNPDSGEGLIIVALNDSGGNQTRTGIQTAFAPGTILKDYSGNNSNAVTVGGDGKVSITVPGRGGQGWVCYAPFNARGPATGSPIEFSGSGVSQMPWVVPGGRDGVNKPRTVTRVTGNAVTIDIFCRTPEQGGETIDNVLLRWGNGLPVNANGVFAGNSIVSSGYTQPTKIADGHYRITADLTNIPEGLHTVKARAFNARPSGRPALFQTFTTTVYVDRTGPSLEMQNLAAGETIQGARVITVNNPDNTLYNLTYSIDGGPQQQADMVIRGRWRIALNGLSSGAHSITLNATEADYGANRSVINSSTLTRAFNVDTVGSSIALNHTDGVVLAEPFFKTIVTVPTGQGITASDIKLYWNGYEQRALTESPAGSGNFESVFTGHYREGGVEKYFTGAFVNGPHFFEAVVTKNGQENRVARRVVFNLYGQNLHDSDGDGIPDEIELSGFLNGTNPGPDRPWPGDNSQDLIPNYGENWTRLNPMGSDTTYNGTWDGDEDWDGDGVSNLQEVIRGYRLTGDPFRYSIYDRNSTPPASTSSSASSVLGTVGGVKTATITYRPNDGPLKGLSPVRVRITPAGGGSEAFYAMTQVNANEFTYAYPVPAGVTSIAYLFSNGDGTSLDTTGSGWTLATPAVASSATASLGSSGSGLTLTVIYAVNEGPLAGQSSVNINLAPAGGGSPSSAVMTSLGNGQFSYTYTIPAGVSTVSYTFSSGATTDTTGSDSWIASTSSGFEMDGEFDSQNFVVADNGMRIYAAVRGTKLYVATWSTKGGVNDHFLYITDEFGDPVTQPWAKAGRLFGKFDFSGTTKPWVGANPDQEFPNGFKASGKSFMGAAGKALETEIDMLEVFGRVPKIIYLATVAYPRANGGAILSQAPASFGNWADDVEVAEFQAVNTASIRDENLDGHFDVGRPELRTVVGNDNADANYNIRRFYLDERLKESGEITVRFKPNTAPGSLVSNVEVFTNLNRRDFAVLEENPATVTTSGVNDAGVGTYFRAYPMTGPDAEGFYTATLPVNRCGAYRLQARYKINGGNYVYYTDHALRRDLAIVVSPKKALQANMYEVNPLVVEAKDNTFAGRSTFLDLVNDPDLPGESVGYQGRPDALNKNHYRNLGVNMLWLQPIHPIGIDGRDTNPETGQAFDPGSPYAVQDYWSVAPMLGRGNTAGDALQEFQTFINRLDSWGVDVMMDGTFNHSAPDVVMGQAVADLGLPYAPTAQIRDANFRWYAKEGFPAQQATSRSDIAIAPDRNDFGNWTDVREFYFGVYDTLVKAKGAQNPDKSYSDNAHKYEFLLERDEFFGHTQETREVWEYFAYYPTYWLEKTGHPRGTPKEQSYKGIDGLRCDFAQGLPSQFWEYCINKTRSVKWDFLFMAESLDGFREVAGNKRHGVGYRSARHFDILNENIVFYWRDQFFGYPANQVNDGVPTAVPGTPATPSTGATFNAYDTRRQAFDNVTLLNNLVSHDEVFPHNDVFSIAYAYAQVSALDGIPMIFYGQEAGAQNSSLSATATPTGGYAATQANFGAINPARNFAKYEANFGKNIPNFKVFNNMVSIWNSRDLDNGLGWSVQGFYERVTTARLRSPALKSQNVYFLNRLQQGGGFDDNIFAVGKVQVPGLSAGQQDVMLVFVNNNYRVNSAPAALFDLRGTAPGGTDNYFGIERARSYNVRDLVSDDPNAFVWSTPKTGADILDNGFYVGLPYQGKHAHYLKLIDINSDYTDTDGDGLTDATDPDIDGDGIPNWWEQENFGSPTGAVAGSDNDGDGYSNLVEFLAGTVPTDRNSALRIAEVAPGGPHVDLTWQSVPGVIYKVRYSSDLAIWSDYPGGPILAEDASTTVRAQAPQGQTYDKLFFTVSVVP